ncbi:hypothetical protein PR002_g26964 [Phytophthora rubi]|uniref:Uncharacterized protein n=2 Tax=Phytophthora rubi TaxID=129364 RepID=A0A6A3HNL2_9STRA|nr:hypothetical protein PR002_g26964 [Phytophthora rubi]
MQYDTPAPAAHCEEPRKMPKERSKRIKRHTRQLGPLQCQYPGHCENERAVKVNRERHWLCDEHRDHQNALQRDSYRRTAEKKTKREKSKRVRASPEKATNDVTSQASPSPERASATASSAPDQAADSTGSPGRACVGVGDADSAQPRTQSSAAPRVPAQDTNIRGVELQQNPSAASQLQVLPLDFAGDAGFQTQKQHPPCVHHVGAPVQRQQPVYFLLQAIPLVTQAPAQRTLMGCCATPQAGYAPMTFVTGDSFSPELLMQGQQFAVPASQGHYAAASALHTCVVGSAMRAQHAAGSFSSQCVGTQMAPPSVEENTGNGNGRSNNDCRLQEL